MNDDILSSEVGNRVLSSTDYAVVKASDPAEESNVIAEETFSEPVIISVLQRSQWTCRRVYSKYLSREVFTDPFGLEWVRISDAAFNPATDILVEMRSRGLSPMGLRRRDAAAAHLRKKE
jgi:hypothetical protein